MTDPLHGNDDLFFSSALTADSPSHVFGYDVSTAEFQSPMPVKARKINAESQGIREGAALSTSPESSMQDSSSDSSGRHQRKSSSRSSQSVNTCKDSRAGNIAGQARQWMSPSTTPDGNLDFGHDQGFQSFEFSNRAMEDAFDFESAASSPSPLMSVKDTPYTATRHVAIPYRESPQPAPRLLSQNPKSRTVRLAGESKAARELLT